MKQTDRVARRSDEIRRRRMADSHVAYQSTQRRKRPSALLRWLNAGRASKSKTQQHFFGVGETLRQRKKLGRAYDLDTHASPPVMARGSLDGMTRPGSRRHRTARKLHNVPLNAQGAEMRIPSLPRIGIGWRVASFALLVLTALTLYLLWTSPMYRVEMPKVKGLKQITTSDVSKALALKGSSVVALDSGRMQQTLLDTFPEFSTVVVQVDFPNTVYITVTERVPVLVWKQDGRSYLVDAEGMTFPARAETDDLASTYVVVEASGDLPAFIKPVRASDPAGTGETEAGESIRLEEQQKAQEAIRSLGALTDQLPFTLPAEARARAFLPPEMVTVILRLSQQLPKGSQLLYDPERGFGWQDRRGWQVYMGNFGPDEPTAHSSDLAEVVAVKLQVYRAILERVRSLGEKPSLISVEYLHAPYYRVEQGQ